MARRDLDDWLEPVVTNMIAIRQLGSDIKSDKQSMDLLRACSQLAYSQICMWCQREFHSLPNGSYYLENHPNGTQACSSISPQIRLRNTPLIELKKVELIIAGEITELVEDTDFWVRNNVIYGLSTKYPIEVTYNGGVDSLENDYILIGALTQQGLANYHRRDLLGISNMTTGGPGSNSSIAVTSDAGGLLKSVQAMVESLRYYGDAVLLTEGVVVT